ncbi:hypothetical protein HMPREF9338_01724 [Cutibacterium acnes HL096PA2]|nr:hypothetical protein HMPREF9207_0162 [Cutibacterium acnes J165]EFS35264.1 hypothetical protein HMPREF9567_01699 [Cutibacterium acnes HL013PA1]EFS43583.1 hypothetical protein HMPREF9576_01305 [Cutibacterium acnes HL110PA2]EFS58537.1 hypothetical protein HMPREF9604_01555 [Cutibacterium acnes HL036PA1]EFS60129.1 hypothetical protein HMPREF9605_02358 [Cutibacterium acnes HL036PA2]EFS63504.1 hypothetical protein HMPREF9611_01553 [Cutibacterium acnes HL063PA1]EFT03993.1 hypothetical protein HMPR
MSTVTSSGAVHSNRVVGIGMARPIPSSDKSDRKDYAVGILPVPLDHLPRPAG